MRVRPLLPRKNVESVRNRNGVAQHARRMRGAKDVRALDALDRCAHGCCLPVFIVAAVARVRASAVRCGKCEMMG
ncbi:hypothetical protein WS68_17810 [Burkholderia sp. TSV86]|nr:hypothetical protein WS68_17810 [Burkholderia sp. TSV86]